MPLGTERLPDTDFTGTLGNGHQHDVHNADAGHQQGNAGDAADHEGHGGNHLIHGIQQLRHGCDRIEVRVLEYRIQIILDIALDRHRITDLVLRHCEGIAVDLPVPGQLHRRGIGNVDEIVGAALLQVLGFTGLPLHNTHDGEALAVDLDGLVHGRIRRTEIGLGHIETDDRHLLTGGNVGILDKTAVAEAFVKNVQIFLGYTGHLGGGGVFIAHLHRTLHRHAGRQMAEVLLVLLVVRIHLVHGNRTAGQVDDIHRDPVGAHAGEAFRHVAQLAVDDAHQGNDGTHTDDDAQHGQEGPHLVGPYALDCKIK